MKHKLLAGLLLAALYTAAGAQTFNRARMDSLFTILESNKKVMGSIAIYKNGVLQYSKSVGCRYIRDNNCIPANINTRYRVGSISKMFTATMILQMVDEGKLGLDKTIESWFPTLPNAKVITIRNLLNHRSGLHDFTGEPDFSTWMTKAKTHEEILDIITRGGTDFEPDHQAVYNNVNFILLGYIVEKVSGGSYAKALNDRICSRIGLMNTYVGAWPDTTASESFSYSMEKYWVQEPSTDMSIPGGAGAIVSTTPDLAKFIQSLFNGKLVTPPSLLKMKTMVDGFGMGMFAMPYYDKKAFGHAGDIDGFASSIGYFPQDSVAIAFCANGMSYDRNSLLLGVLNIYYNQPYQLPKVATYSSKPEDLDKYIGTYSSTTLPIKITITKDSVTLIAQASGQSAFILEPVELHKFKFDQAGIRLDFNPDRREMTLRQGGGTFLFTLEKK